MRHRVLNRRQKGDDSGRSPAAGPRVAYLTNAYPKVSHSFIRREIQALERQGFEVTRVSIRPCRDVLPDADDRAELDRTHVLLDGRYGQLALSLLANLLARPLGFLAALRMAVATGYRGAAGIGRSLVYLLEACRLARLMNGQGIRHLHVHFGTNPAAVARLARQLCGTTFSMTLHGPDEFDAAQALLLREKIADAAFVVAISDFGRGQLLRWARASDWPKINVVRCGLDGRLLKAGAGSDDHGYGQSNTLVCVGRLSAQKGMSLLLNAVAQVVRDTPLNLRIVGDGELRGDLESQIARLGLERRVRLLGWRSAEDVRREILNSRALVLPSLAEGLPIVLMEALALGRPVIATCIAGVPELVDEECGCLIPAGSEAALEEALREVLGSHPRRLAAMGAVGRARVLRNHDADRNAAQLATLMRPLAQP